MRPSAHASPRDRSSRSSTLSLAVLCLLVATAAAVVAGFAWARPTTRALALPYRQVGSLSYSAPASASSVYGAAGLSTGQPIYIHVVSTVSVTYDYELSAAASKALSGTEQLVATIRNGQGVAQTVPIQQPTLFHGNQFSATATLHLVRLEAIARSFNAATGGVVSYSVSLSPHVELHGHLGSLPLKASFDPSTNFVMTSTSMAPVASSAGLAGSASLGRIQSFRSIATGDVTRPHWRANTLLRLPVGAVRIGALILFVIATAALVLLVRPILEDVTSDDERVRLSTRYGASLIQVRALPSLAVVELSSFTGVSQVARKLECPILHLLDDGDDTYAVVDNGTLYRYRIRMASHLRATENGHVPVTASVL